uniref:Uncharacterized protein n=1 Tax=Physcomitrium patens TaxID=3218 RepID=A0A2K1JZK9_PHYPA|nr:hypothetical protein PHYPA_014083 [Physcomitrium patens]
MPLLLPVGCSFLDHLPRILGAKQPYATARVANRDEALGLHSFRNKWFFEGISLRISMKVTVHGSRFSSWGVAVWGTSTVA